MHMPIKSIKLGMEFGVEEGEVGAGAAQGQHRGISVSYRHNFHVCVCVCFGGVKCIYTKFFAPQYFCKKVLISCALLFGKYLNF